MQKKQIFFILVTAMAVTAFCAESTLTKTFQAGSGGTLEIKSDHGSIIIDTHEKNQVDYALTVKKGDKVLDEEEAMESYEIEFDQSGNDISVILKKRSESDTWFGLKTTRQHVQHKVTLPRSFNCDVLTAGGSISVDDLDGTAKTHTSGGSLSFGRIDGNIMGSTSGGSISITECSGDAEIKSSGGSLKIGRVNGSIDASTSGGSISIERSQGSVVAKTAGGSINIDEVYGNINAKTSGGSISATILEQPSGDCSLKTSGGSIRVTVAKGLQVNLDAKTSGGRVRTDFPVTLNGDLKKNELVTELNGGGPLLQLRTAAGNISIEEYTE